MNFAEALTRGLNQWQDETIWLTPDVVTEMMHTAARQADDLSDLRELLEQEQGEAK